MRAPLTPRQALIRAEDLCARAERCQGEIRLKLRQWGIQPSDADRIVDSLVDRKFIDDNRFAHAFAREKVAFSRWGRLKIRAALAAKRIPPDIIREALDAIDPDEYSRALKATVDARRRAIADPDTYDGRTRVFRHAAARGFEPDLVVKAIRAAASSCTD